jgi:hypothetical protein
MWQVLGNQDQIGLGADNQNILPVACQKCYLTFCDQTAYEQHHFSCHDLNAKRRRTGKFGEPVVGRDGKFVCPICQKTFEEESRYFGHVGSHARYQGLTPEAFFDKAASAKVADVSLSLQDLTGSPGQNNKVSDGEAGFQHHNHSNEHGGNNSTVTEFFSMNCSDNLIRPNKASRHIADAAATIPSDTGYAAAKIPNTSHQYVTNTIGFGGVNVFNGQVASNHVARPAFGTANHYEYQIADHGIAPPKHADNNTAKARGVNLNSSLDTISFPITSANNETSAALNEVNQSSLTAKYFSGSFNNDGASSASSCSGSTNKISSSVDVVNKTSAVASRSFDPSYGSYCHDYGALKANPFANKDNTTVYQANLGTQPVYPVATKADCLASRQMQQKNSGKERMPNTKDQMDNAKYRTSKEAGFYNSGGGITERSFAQFNNSVSHIKPNAGNFIKGSVSDVNCMKGSLGNEMQNRYSDRVPACDPHTASRTSRNANGLMSTQANFVNMSSAVQSVGDVPVTSTTQDQVT